jgi:FAD binding domain
VNWDQEVDVVCTGSGFAGLAGAISVVDHGGEVFVAGPRRNTATRDGKSGVGSRAVLHPRLDGIVSDPETNEYFAALSCDLHHPSRPDRDVDLPVRVANQPVSVGRGATVAPFVGSRLRDWAASCLASQTGYIYTRVAAWPSATLHTNDGDSIEVAEIGSMTPDPRDVGGSMHKWLATQARQRHIDSHPDSSLQRLVFQDGDVLGAVFTTSAGPLAIRARHGLFVTTGDTQVTPARQQAIAENTNMRVTLVGQTASRFGRVELVNLEPNVEIAPSVCRQHNRRLHVSLRETQAYSQAWRCG